MKLDIYIAATGLKWARRKSQLQSWLSDKVIDDRNVAETKEIYLETIEAMFMFLLLKVTAYIVVWVLGV